MEILVRTEELGPMLVAVECPVMADARSADARAAMAGFQVMDAIIPVGTVLLAFPAMLRGA